MRPPRSSARTLVTVLVMAIASVLAASLALEMPALVTTAAVASTAFGLAMWVAGGRDAVVRWRRAGARSAEEADDRWNAQIFSFFLAIPMLVPAALMPRSTYTHVVACIAIAMALVSTLTPFCVGRMVYVAAVKPMFAGARR